MSPSNRSRSGSRWLNRRLAFRLHGWCGFLLSILLLTICLTGTLAVVGHEIDWLLNPDLRVSEQDGPPAFSAMHRNVRALYPDSRLLWLAAPVGPGFAAEAVIRRPGMEHPWRVYAEPATGAIRGEAGWLTAQRFLRNLHMNLFSPGWGKYLVSAFGMIVSVSLITGTVIYRKWWRGYFRLDRTQGRRVLMGGAHKLLGVWSLWFIALMALTGTWYFVEELLFDLTDFAYVSAPSLDPGQLGARGPLADLDAIAEDARREIPRLRVGTIWLPAGPGGVISVRGQAAAVLVRDRANMVHFHPYSGELLGAQRAEDLSWARYWVDMADPLHFGNFGGLASKLVWFVFGLGLNAMIVTGSWLYLRRVRRSGRAEQ